MDWLCDVPDPPEHFGEIAAQKWCDVCRWCLDGPGLRQQDLPLVEAAAIAYENHRLAMVGVSQHGLAIVGFDKEGNQTIKTNAYVTESRVWMEAMVRRLVDLGLARDSQIKSEGKPVAGESDEPGGLGRLRIVS